MSTSAGANSGVLRGKKAWVAYDGPDKVRRWKRYEGRLSLGTICELGEHFIAGHEGNPNYGSGLAVEEDFTVFFRYYGGLKEIEQSSVRAYVNARLGVVRRASAPVRG